MGSQHPTTMERERMHHLYEIAEYNDEKTVDDIAVKDVDVETSYVLFDRTNRSASNDYGISKTFVEHIERKNQQASLKEILDVSAREVILARRWKFCLILAWLFTATCIAVGTYAVLRTNENKKYQAAVSITCVFIVRTCFSSIKYLIFALFLEIVQALCIYH
jgi:hypothetical protein